MALKQPAVESQPSRTLTTEMNPVRKVITLIEEMKAQVEKEAEDDLNAYEKYQCWCDTNKKEKADAIESAQKRIEELTAFLEAAKAKEGELKSQIEGLKRDIADDQEALQTATETREKTFETFLEQEADMKETRKLLQEAIDVLQKVQFLQRNGQDAVPVQAKARSVLVQINSRVQEKHPKFANVMQRDLFDVFGSLDNFVSNNAGFLPRRDVAAFDQQPVITEEQAGKDAKPNELKGAAANAKSYNSRSGGILGILGQMHDTFSSDLADAQKTDLTDEVNFQNLRAAKLGEIREATLQKENAEADLADTLQKAAEANEDLQATTKALEADQEFVLSLTKDCKIEDEQYKARFKIRSEEIRAIGETLKILSEDDARDLYAKTMDFFQIAGSSGRSVSSEMAIAQEHALNRAVQRITKVAEHHKDLALVSLAVRMRLDGFAKVKEAMDKMMVELDKQQKDEYAKWEFCRKEIDKTEDSIWVGKNTKEDLDEKHQDLVNTLDNLNKELEALKKDEAETLLSMKQAGETRKAENAVFQQAVMDQRATANILRKALERLKQFYAPEADVGTKLVQVHAHDANDPGRASSLAPAKGRSYEKSGGSGGVMQLLMKIISDAEVEEQELTQGEQKSQQLYAEFVDTSTKTVDANRASQSEKNRLIAETKSEKAETEEAQLTNDGELEKLEELLKGHHVNCDFLLKFFDVRQTARKEEMEAIQDAKAILSGADFKPA